MIGMSIAPIPIMAADPQTLTGVWEGTLDPGAQAKKRIVVHISAAQDGSFHRVRFAVELDEHDRTSVGRKRERCFWSHVIDRRFVE